jgi:3' exoribonuclease, RNase T-like
MPLHAMIDMETLDTAPSTVILTIGAVLFDPRGVGIIDRIELRPTIDEQTDVYGRTISNDTLRWWSEQSPDAINEAMGDQGRISYKECMEKLYKFCWQRDKVWSNGSVFDIMVAENAFRDLDMKFPWNFWDIRDCRTIYDVAGVSLKDSGHVTSHKAVEDAERQAIVVQKAYQKLIHAGMTHIR